METIETDILVVGAGLAGFSAAVRAAETGAKVLLIDKSRGELGDGNVLMASGSLRAGGKSPRTDAAELQELFLEAREGTAADVLLIDRAVGDFAFLVEPNSSRCGLLDLDTDSL